MSAIRSRGRRSSTSVPNWRLEDLRLDPYDRWIAEWLASHTDAYRSDTVSRNEIARVLGISGERVTKSIEALRALGIIVVHEAPNGQGGGVRWVIEFDFEVWETDDLAGRHTTSSRSPHDQQAGRHTTSSIGHQEEGYVEPEGSTRVAARSGEMFEQFWAQYPNKRAKKAAREAWDRLKPLERQAALDGIGPWVAAQTKRDLEFVPYGQRWLSKHRWTDEVHQPEANPNGVVAATDWRERFKQMGMTRDAS